MKVLITGGAGFIGSHLAEALLEKGYIVTIIDNLATGHLDNIKHLEKNPNFEFIYDSILNYRTLERALEDVKYVFHFAASVGVKYILENKLDSIVTNVRGTEILLDLVDKKKIGILFASTSEVYGLNDSGKLTEEDNRIMGVTTVHRWSYACAKALDEFLMLAFYKERELPVKIVRFFNVCGPRQTGQYGMVVPGFVKRALESLPIEVYGNGKQIRSFTHVQDAVDAVIKIFENKKTEGKIYNIGSENVINIWELAVKVKEILNSQSEIKFVSYEDAYPEGFEDMKRRVPDISKIRLECGYEPKFNMNDIIKDIAEYYKRK
ncbi:MAG: GDP-mannose 4,6-dehydratase [Candidatus Aureabacteria bacterium]|nr:GDP-mannose 4,6-dehydratase [Candidatus Auribacterota bacterium]